MILPTANGVAAPQSTHQSKAKLDKTQVGAAKALQPRETSSVVCDSARLGSFLFISVSPCVRLFSQISSSSSTSAPVNTGVRLPTCKFSLREKFLTSPADLFRVFLNQEVSLRVPTSRRRRRRQIKSLSSEASNAFFKWISVMSSLSPPAADGPGVHARPGHCGRPEGRKVSPARGKYFWRVHRAGETRAIFNPGSSTDWRVCDGVNIVSFRYRTRSW